MDNARWEQIKSIFSAAMDHTAAERSAFLDLACANDPDLRREIESLLHKRTQDIIRTGGAAHAIAESATATSPFAPLTERPGTVIGQYKLLQQIGEGGFGTVFLAEQSKPVRRRVALKIIKLGMDTKSVIARFEAERQALALMEHPHIARVLDAGATDTGRPYFVMEYVIGDSITHFSDAHKLNVRQRLELFSQVCQAVQHAHTKGVIHRDIKPGNILVSMSDGKPFAKVIDFGIAKATAAPLTDKTLFTEHRQLIGTPEYMSPEQAEGSADIDTRTDVYALGVLLYELLTGLTPFDGARLRSAAWIEMQRIIREEDPPAPSIRLSRDLNKLAATAAARHALPSNLSTQIKGELDWIVMKALDKDRARRYETPNQFAMDVQHHLAGEAVVAAPLSNAYRLRKFVRRNKGAAVLGAAILFGLAGTSFGLVIADYNARVATQNATTALFSRDAAEWSAYTANLALAQAMMGVDNWPDARARVAACPVDKHGWEWQFLDLKSRAVKRVTIGDFYGGAALSPDGSQFVTGSFDGVVRVWDSNTSESLAKFEAHKKAINSICFSPEGERIATACEDGTVRVWNFVTKALIAEFADSMWAGTYSPMVFSPDGSRLLTACEDGTIRLRNIDARTMLGELKPGLGGVTKDILPLSAIALSPEGCSIASTGSEGVITIWDVPTLSKRHYLKSPDGYAAEVAFNNDGTRIVTSNRGGFCIWDVQTGKLLVNTQTLERDTLAVAFSRDGSRVLTASPRSAVQAWDAASGENLSELPALGDTFRNRFCGGNGDRLIWYGQGYMSVHGIAEVGGPETRMGQYSDEAPLVPLEIDATIEPNPVPQSSSLEVRTPDGTRRIVGSADRTLRFFDTSTGKEVAVFTMPSAVTKLQMSADGTRLAISMGEKSATLWDIRSPADRMKDRQFKWTQRKRMGEYLDALWAGPIETARLQQTIIDNLSLPPLQRLVAAQMLGERLRDRERLTDNVLTQIAQGKTNPAAVQAAARAADLPPRLKELVIIRADQWRYEPKSDAEKLANETHMRQLAEGEAKRLGEAVIEEAKRIYELSKVTPFGFAAGDSDAQLRLVSRLYGAVYGEQDARTRETFAWSLIAGIANNRWNVDSEALASAIEAYRSVGDPAIASQLTYAVSNTLIPRFRASMAWLDKLPKEDHRSDQGTRWNHGSLCSGIYMDMLVDWPHNSDKLTPKLPDVIQDCQALCDFGTIVWQFRASEHSTLALALFRTNALPEALEAVSKAVSIRSIAQAEAARIGTQLRAEDHGESPIDLSILAIVQHQLSQIPGADPTLSTVAHDAFVKARSIMSDPASAETWAKDPDAQSLFREAEALIDPK